MIDRRLSRRRFLVLAGVAGLGAAAGIRLIVEREGEQSSALGRTAAALFDDPGAARRVGDAYLDLREAERSPPVLASHLSEGSAELGRALRSGDLASLRRLASRRVTRELARGHVVTVEGWLLAPTEARLAALATYG